MAPQSVPVIHSEDLVWSFVVSPGSLTLPEEWTRVVRLGWVEGAGGGEEVGTGIDSKMRKVVCFLKKIYLKKKEETVNFCYIHLTRQKNSIFLEI